MCVLWCWVLVLCVYMWCCVLCVQVVCGEAWHAENPPCVRSKRLRVYGQDVPVCTGNRPASLANDFAVVRLETKEGPFHYRNISGEEIIF